MWGDVTLSLAGMLNLSKIGSMCVFITATSSSTAVSTDHCPEDAHLSSCKHEIQKLKHSTVTLPVISSASAEFFLFKTQAVKNKPALINVVRTSKWFDYHQHQCRSCSEAVM